MGEFRFQNYTAAELNQIIAVYKSQTPPKVEDLQKENLHLREIALAMYHDLIALKQPVPEEAARIMGRVK